MIDKDFQTMQQPAVLRDAENGLVFRELAMPWQFCKNPGSKPVDGDVVLSVVGLASSVEGASD